MMKFLTLLISCLLILSGCSSKDDPQRAQKQQSAASSVPTAPVEAMDSQALDEEVEPAKRELLLRKTPVILINTDDDDMTRLD